MIDADTHSASPSHPPSITPVHLYPPVYASASHVQDDNTAPPPPFSSVPSLDDEKDAAAAVSVREIMRTPSPTPTEARVLSEKTRMCDLKRMAQLLHWRRFTTKRGACEWGLQLPLELDGGVLTMSRDGDRGRLYHSVLRYIPWAPVED